MAVIVGAYRLRRTRPLPLATTTALDRQGELGPAARLRRPPDCDDVMVDLSKNQSRRYCSPSCADRINVAACGAPRSAAAG